MNESGELAADQSRVCVCVRAAVIHSTLSELLAAAAAANADEKISSYLCSSFCLNCALSHDADAAVASSSDTLTLTLQAFNCL